MEYLDLLRRLSREQGVSGRETGIAQILTETLSPLADNVQKDNLGNIIVRKKGEGPYPHPKVMLAAHMDEIGLMVTKVLEGGFLRFTSVGGIDLRTLPGQEVIIHGLQPIRGVIGPNRPPASSRGKEGSLAGEEMYIDTGYGQEKELAEIVPLGTVVTIERDCKY